MGQELLPGEVINRTVNIPARPLRWTGRIDRIFHIFDGAVNALASTLGWSFVRTSGRNQCAANQQRNES